jgi:hypothetical protein
MREIRTSGSMSGERKRNDGCMAPSHRASPRLYSSAYDTPTSHVQALGLRPIKSGVDPTYKEISPSFGNASPARANAARACTESSSMRRTSASMLSSFSSGLIQSMNATSIAWP